MAEVVTEILTDDVTGLKFAEDIRGYWHLIQEALEGEIKDEFYLQQVVKNNIWPDVDNFHSLPTPLTFTKNVDSYLSFVLASHDFKNAIGIGAIGLFIDNIMKLMFPFNQSIHYLAYKPILIPATQVCEVKYRPFNKRADLAINAGFYSIL